MTGLVKEVKFERLAALPTRPEDGTPASMPDQSTRKPSAAGRHCHERALHRAEEFPQLDEEDWKW